MKKRTRNIILVIIGVLISLFIFRAFYRNYNFENDNQTLLELKTKAGNGEIKYVLNKLNLCNDVLRLPLMSVSKELRSQINEELNNFNL